MNHLRGAEKLQRFDAARETRNPALIKGALSNVLRMKLSFSSVAMRAKEVSLLTDIHRTTLLRNQTYKALLLDTFRRQRGAVRVVSADTQDPNILRAKLMAAELEISNLRQQLQRNVHSLQPRDSERGAMSSNEALTFNWR
jgi:hypothetical protein